MSTDHSHVVLTVGSHCGKNVLLCSLSNEKVMETCGSSLLENMLSIVVVAVDNKEHIYKLKNEEL